MSYRKRLQSWAVIRLLKDMQRITICRFRKESDADGYAKALRQLTPDGKFLVVFDPPTPKLVDALEDLQVVDRLERS